MISTQDIPCLQHHKVTLGQSCAFSDIFTLHCSVRQPCLVYRTATSSCNTVDSATNTAFSLLIFIMFLSGHPSQALQSTWPLRAACAHQAALAQASSPPQKQPLFKATAMEDSALPADHIKSVSAGHASAVAAEFAKAGISAEVTQKVLKQYKPYLSWDVETKLRPALQSWLQELGSVQLSQQLQKVQCFLVCTPKEHNEVYSWLVSMGVSAARMQQKAPLVMTREIRAVQSTFEALQQAAAFSDAQMCALLHKHPVALAYGPERVLSTLKVVSALLETPMTSDSFTLVIIAAHDRLFAMSPVTLHQRVAFFCQMYATGTHVARTAITMGVFVTPEPVMPNRAAKLQELLDWDSEQLKQKLSAQPNILNYEPSTIACNVHEMHGVGFSLTQVWAMCTKQPSLLALRWTSDTSVEKVQFVTLMLGLSLDDIAAVPTLMTFSVNGCLGPRVWFRYQTGVIEAPNTVLTSGLFGHVWGGSKA